MVVKSSLLFASSMRASTSVDILPKLMINANAAITNNIVYHEDIVAIKNILIRVIIKLTIITAMLHTKSIKHLVYASFILIFSFTVYTPSLERSLFFFYSYRSTYLRRMYMMTFQQSCSSIRHMLE